MIDEVKAFRGPIVAEKYTPKNESCKLENLISKAKFGCGSVRLNREWYAFHWDFQIEILICNLIKIAHISINRKVTEKNGVKSTIFRLLFSRFFFK